MIRARSSLTGIESEYESMFELYISDAHFKLSQMFEERVTEEETSAPLFTDIDDEDFHHFKLMFQKSKLFNGLQVARCMFVSIKSPLGNAHEILYSSLYVYSWQTCLSRTSSKKEIC